MEAGLRAFAMRRVERMVGVERRKAGLERGSREEDFQLVVRAGDVKSDKARRRLVLAERRHEWSHGGMHRLEIVGVVKGRVQGEGTEVHRVDWNDGRKSGYL